MGQAQQGRRVHQLLRCAQLPLLGLEEDRRFELADHHQVALPVAVQVAGRQVAADRVQIGNTELDRLGPLARLGLKSNHQVIGGSQVGQVGTAVTVVVADHQRVDLAIDGNLAVLEPPVTLDRVDLTVGIRDRLSSRLLLALVQVVDATVAVVGQHEIDQPVAVDISSHQVARSQLQLEDLDRLEPEVLSQRRGSSRLLGLGRVTGQRPDQQQHGRHGSHEPAGAFHPGFPHQFESPVPASTRGRAGHMLHSLQPA